MAKAFAIRDKKLEVASVGRVDSGAEHFVDDAVADGEPKSATGVVSSTDTFLVGMRPARLDSWPSESRTASGETCCAHNEINFVADRVSSNLWLSSRECLVVLFGDSSTRYSKSLNEKLANRFQGLGRSIEVADSA